MFDGQCAKRAEKSNCFEENLVTNTINNAESYYLIKRRKTIRASFKFGHRTLFLFCFKSSLEFDDDSLEFEEEEDEIGGGDMDFYEEYAPDTHVEPTSVNNHR